MGAGGRTAWAVLHAALGVTVALSLALGAREDRLVGRFVAGVLKPGMTQSERAVRITEGVRELMDGRMERFAPPRGRDLVLPTTVTRMIAEGGACGARSRVLARSLQVAGFDVRIVQMKVGSRWGAHIAVVAEVDGRWVPLDGLFGLAFRNPDGSLASLEEVQGNWPAYRGQAPARYDARNDYSAIRYANWEKIPILLPALRGALELVAGPAFVEHFSLRPHILNVPRTVGLALLAFWALLAAIQAGIRRRWA